MIVISLERLSTQPGEQGKTSRKATKTALAADKFYFVPPVFLPRLSPARGQ